MLSLYFLLYFSLCNPNNQSIFLSFKIVFQGERRYLPGVILLTLVRVGLLDKTISRWNET